MRPSASARGCACGRGRPTPAIAHLAPAADHLGPAHGDRRRARGRSPAPAGLPLGDHRGAPPGRPAPVPRGRLRRDRAPPPAPPRPRTRWSPTPPLAGIELRRGRRREQERGARRRPRRLHAVLAPRPGRPDRGAHRHDDGPLPGGPRRARASSATRCAGAPATAATSSAWPSRPAARGGASGPPCSATGCGGCGAGAPATPWSTPRRTTAGRCASTSAPGSCCSPTACPSSSSSLGEPDHRAAGPGDAGPPRGPAVTRRRVRLAGLVGLAVLWLLWFGRARPPVRARRGSRMVPSSAASAGRAVARARPADHLGAPGRGLHRRRPRHRRPGRRHARPGRARAARVARRVPRDARRRAGRHRARRGAAGARRT